jgi:aldehyde:ferredoxin oxidoreductase
MKNGYMEKVLRIDLAKGKIETIDFPEDVRKQYIGGSGLAAWYLYQETKPEQINPLGPENTWVLLTGPVAGTAVYSSSRFAVAAKAPLTGIWGEANSGGKFAKDLKSAGYDGLILQNASPKPVTIVVTEEKAEIKDAKHLWGKDSYELETLVKSEYGTKSNFAGVGPAGEKMIPLAAVMNDGIDGRAAGRGGLGAVLGSKKVKAIVVLRGSKRTPLHDQDEFMKSVRAQAQDMKQGPEILRQFGTSCGMAYVEEVGDLPIKNWAKGRWAEGASKISGQRMAETILTRRYHCGQCAIGCGRTVKVDKHPYMVPESAGPEYETLGMLGSNCLIDNLEAIAKANELCNRYGLDTISTGGVIAFSMEAYEQGLITKKDTDGIEMTWGNADAMIAMVKAIGEGKGFGKILGQGVRRAAAAIGGNAEEFAVHVKGLELPAHDPRSRFSTVLSYTTSNRGACHMNVFGYDFESATVPPAGLGYDRVQDPYQVDGKAQYAIAMQDLMAVFDSLSACKFILFGKVGVPTLAHWLTCITGWAFDIESLLKAGARAFTVKRLYNNRLGISRKDDILPLRISNFPRDDGGAKDVIPPQARLLNDYYHLRKWTEFGRPTQEALRELEITM